MLALLRQLQPLPAARHLGNGSAERICRGSGTASDHQQRDRHHDDGRRGGGDHEDSHPPAPRALGWGPSPVL